MLLKPASGAGLLSGADFHLCRFMKDYLTWGSNSWMKESIPPFPASGAAS